MLCVDVNVLVYAHRPDTPRHDEYRKWLEGACDGAEPLGLASSVLTGFLRIVTHPRIFADPSPIDVALDFANAVLGSAAGVPVDPGSRHWEIFTELCRTMPARGNLIPDASLAALAIEQGATWVSADRVFAGIPGLRWRHPLSN